MWQDGETEVMIGAKEEVNPSDHLAFDGMLETPSRIVIVSTVEYETILRSEVSGTKTHVQIWINREKEPDKVIIGLE